MTRVKLCGITSLEDALMCAEHRPWALGLIFVPHSKRRIRLGEAASVTSALRRQVELAGVFENAALDHVVGRTQ